MTIEELQLALERKTHECEVLREQVEDLEGEIDNLEQQNADLCEELETLREEVGYDAD